MKVLVWGGGNHQGYGHRTYPDVVLVTTSMDRVEVWEPEDLTLVVDAGAPIAKVEERLAEHRQTTLLPHHSPTSTIGGALAAGLSGYQRFRYGPSRDRLLETRAITGDGRIVRSGGRVVKNVTGYDIPRLMVGSLGRLGPDRLGLPEAGSHPSSGHHRAGGRPGPVRWPRSTVPWRCSPPRPDIEPSCGEPRPRSSRRLPGWAGTSPTDTPGRPRPPAR